MKHRKSPSPESRHAHSELQNRLLEWANASGFTAAATDVTTRVRDVVADCAAYAMSPEPEKDPIGTTVVFVCVASRDDYLRLANRPSPAAVAKMTNLADQLNALECQLAAGTQQMPVLQEDLFAAIESPTNESTPEEDAAGIRDRITALKASWFHGSLFSRLESSSCATRLIVVCTPAVCAAHELPDGWGMLIPHRVSSDESDDTEPSDDACLWFTQAVTGARHDVPANRRLDLLQRIVRAQSAAAGN